VILTLGIEQKQPKHRSSPAEESHKAMLRPGLWRKCSKQTTIFTWSWRSCSWRFPDHKRISIIRFCHIMCSAGL